MATSGEMLKISGGVADDAGAIFLVPATTALVLQQRQSFISVHAGHALCLFDQMRPWHRVEVRAFAGRLRLAALGLHRVDDAELARLVRAAIRSGRLIAVRQNGNTTSHADRETAVRRRLVRDIEGKSGGRLALRGRFFKLVVDVDLAKVPGRDRYEVVRHQDAADTLAGIAEQQTADLAALLHAAARELTRDWRPPASQPDGIVLLRRLPVVAAAAIERAPAVTPSQMARSMQEVTLEVVVLGIDDKPHRGLSYVIDSPDAATYEGDLGPGARTKVSSGKNGTAALILKWADPE